MTAKDMREFRQYLKQCTDAQVQGVYDKEKEAGRMDYAELAIAEAERRGLSCFVAWSLVQGDENDLPELENDES